MLLEIETKDLIIWYAMLLYVIYAISAKTLPNTEEFILQEKYTLCTRKRNANEKTH